MDVIETLAVHLKGHYHLECSYCHQSISVLALDYFEAATNFSKMGWSGDLKEVFCPKCTKKSWLP